MKFFISLVALEFRESTKHCQYEHFFIRAIFVFESDGKSLEKVGARRTQKTQTVNRLASLSAELPEVQNFKPSKF